MKPVEPAEAAVTSAYERLAAADDPAIAISALPEDMARARVAALVERPDADRLPLLGVPFMVKDNIDVAGLPTTAGCPSFAYHPVRSATVVERLEAAGAIVIAKTNMDQFATGLVGTRSPHGIPRHPTSPELVPGGSSSGSGVAVARGIVPFALGTDTAGSGRVPAAFCGIVGFKPTRGWLSMTGVVPAVRSLDCVAIFAGTVTEAWTVAKLAAGFDPADPFSRRPPEGWSPLLGRLRGPLRVGVGGGIVDLPLDPSVAQVFAIDVTDFLAAGKMLYGGPWVAERYASVGEFVAGAPDVDPVVASIIGAADRWSAVDAVRASEQLARIRRRTEDIWADVDVLVLPTTPFHPTIAQVAADPVGVNNALGVFTTFVNLLDLSAVAVPPNLSVIGPAWQDATVAAIAAELASEPWAPSMAADDEIEIAVVGAHLRGQPLHPQLEGLGARFITATRTAPSYRLFALSKTTPAKPGMMRVGSGGAAIAVEVYALKRAAFGSLVASVGAPLCIGTVELESARGVKGFLCEPAGLDDAIDISQFGGWRAYLATTQTSG